MPNPVRLPKPLADEDVWRVIATLSQGIKRPYLAFVGQLLKRKSIDEVLDAFAEFGREHTEYQLVLAGRNMMGAPIERKIDQIPNITYLGAVTHEQAIALMQGAEIILQPSRNEGLPRASLEALALGKKVLLPPCVPELIEGNEAFTVAEITSEAIREAIRRILHEPGTPKYDLSRHNPDRSLMRLRTVYEKIAYISQQ